MIPSPANLDRKSCVVRGTHRKPGRTQWVTPQQGALQHLRYGRIILDRDPVRFSTGDLETGLLCLAGAATIAVGDRRFDVARYDAVYAPPECEVTVTPVGGACDLAEISAPVAGKYPVQFVSFAEVLANPNLHFETGGPNSRRDLHIVIGKNVEAGRILAGVTFSKPGNWTSWPPHEHAATLEEAYLYIDMPAPAWGLQLVYTDPADPELVVAVREGDVVAMPVGYHPNVAAPGGSINFLWMMAANREVEDRQFGVVTVQPEYAGGGSGLEASRGGK